MKELNISNFILNFNNYLKLSLLNCNKNNMYFPEVLKKKSIFTL